MSDETISWTFGKLEATLSTIHEIVPEKGTAFQARLKNFNRLGLPSGVEMRKGKATQYHVGSIVEMALAVEMTQLGLTPERVVDVISGGWWTTIMAVRLAAQTLVEHPTGYVDLGGPEPTAVFLFFDPSGLRSLMGPIRRSNPDEGSYHPEFASNSYTYGTETILRENIVRLTATTPRMAMVNLTAMLDVLAIFTRSDGEETSQEERQTFFQELLDWSTAHTRPYLSGASLAPRYYLYFRFIQTVRRDFNLADLDALVLKHAAGSGLPEDLVRACLLEYREGKEFDQWR